jgi:hypothetical protein
MVRPPISGDLVVIFAIQQVLHNRRERSVVGGIGQVQCGAKSDTIQHRDLYILDDANRIVSVVPLLHNSSLQLSARRGLSNKDWEEKA